MKETLRVVCSAGVAMALFAPMFVYLLELSTRYPVFTFSALDSVEKLTACVLAVVPFALYYWLQRRFPFLRRYALRRDDDDDKAQ